MDQKHYILIVEGQEDWLGILRQSLSKDEFEIQAARNYDEAIFALSKRAFDLAVIDPVLDGPVQGRYAKQNGHDGLALLTKAVYEFPQMRLLVVSGSVGRELLRNAPELPATLPVMQKQNWDRAKFASVVSQLLAGEDWGPPEPEIDMPTGGQPASPIQTHYSGLTGPLHSTGMTGPLTTGLVPPPVTSSAGKPRVLIIEADPDWQDRLAKMMEGEGYFWRVSPNYEQALERLRLESFHIVLLDLMLGETDTAIVGSKGWQLLEHLMSHAPNTKVIVSSAVASRRDVAKLFMHYPIKGFIDKDSFEDSEFLAAIREQFSGPSLKIQTLGDFRIWRDSKPVTEFGDQYAEQLIKILLTRRGENVSVEELLDCLMPGSDIKSSAANLGTMINNARTALEPDLPRPNDSHFILRSGANYMFNFMANVEVDAEQLRRLVSEGRQHERRGESSEALKDYEAARAIYQGDFLPDERFERWAIQERSALQTLYTDALNRIADLYAETDKLDLAIEAATRSLQVDAYLESTYRRLMRYHTCKGDRHAALGVYRSLVKLFSEFFGEEPSVLTTRLQEDIEAGRTVVCVEAASVSGEWRLGSE